MRTTRAGTARWLLALCVLVAFGVGCSRKVPTPRGPIERDVGEEGLEDRPGAGSSLERARSGLGPGEQGPLGNVLFPFDSYDLDEAARAVLEQNGAWLRENPGAKAELEGHCDSRGTIEYNLGLGARRAKTVQDYLVGQGIAAERLSTISYGKELPLCQEETEECWARNRRVHSVVRGQ